MIQPNQKSGELQPDPNLMGYLTLPELGPGRAWFLNDYVGPGPANNYFDLILSTK